MKESQRAAANAARLSCCSRLLKLSALLLLAPLAGCPGVQVSGNSDSAVSDPAILVNPAAAPPSDTVTIQGTPSSWVTAGQVYSFLPAASDAAGHSLSFAIVNAPSWATFSSATGQLAGTPGAAQAGNYSAILISVSDGMASASLPAFAISVSAAAPTGSATLLWQAPTENIDGTAVTDLAGYHIHFGPSSSDLDQLIDVSGATSTSYVINGLNPGTYYFAVSAYNAFGMEGAFSNIAVKTL